MYIGNTCALQLQSWVDVSLNLGSCKWAFKNKIKIQKIAPTLVDVQMQSDEIISNM